MHQTTNNAAIVPSSTQTRPYHSNLHCSCLQSTDTHYPPSVSLSHDAVALTRIDFPLLGTNVQVDRSDELEERIVIRLGLAFLQPPVPPHQQTHEDLDFLEGEVEADAHPLAGGETVISGLVASSFRFSNRGIKRKYSRNVIRLPPVLDLVRVPPIRIEQVGVVPDLRVHVDVV